MANEELTKIMYADRDKILEELLWTADESASWVAEVSLTDPDQNELIACLGKIAGAVSLTKRLLNIKTPFEEYKEWDDVDEDGRS